MRASEIYEAMRYLYRIHELLAHRGRNPQTGERKTIYETYYKSWYFYGWRESYSEGVACLDDELIDLMLEMINYALETDDAETIVKTVRLLKSKRFLRLLYEAAKPAESIEIEKGSHSGSSAEYSYESKLYYYCPTGLFIVHVRSSGLKPGYGPNDYRSWNTEYYRLETGDVEDNDFAEIIAKEKKVPKEVVEYLLKLGIPLKTIAKASIEIADEATVRSWSCKASLVSCSDYFETYGDVELIEKDTEDTQCGPDPDVAFIYRYKIKNGAIVSKYSCDMGRDFSSSLVIYVYSPKLAQLARSGSRV